MAPNYGNQLAVGGNFNAAGGNFGNLRNSGGYNNFGAPETNYNGPIRRNFMVNEGRGANFGQFSGPGANFGGLNAGGGMSGPGNGGAAFGQQQNFLLGRYLAINV